jgi:hypothetical protein
MGKLIKQDRLEKSVGPDRTIFAFLDLDGLDRIIYLNELKDVIKRLKMYEHDTLQLFGMIFQYLSDESKCDISNI